MTDPVEATVEPATTDDVPDTTTPATASVDDDVLTDDDPTPPTGTPMPPPPPVTGVTGVDAPTEPTTVDPTGDEATTEPATADAEATGPDAAFINPDLPTEDGDERAGSERFINPGFPTADSTPATDDDLPFGEPAVAYRDPDAGDRRHRKRILAGIGIAVVIVAAVAGGLAWYGRQGYIVRLDANDELIAIYKGREGFLIFEPTFVESSDVTLGDAVADNVPRRGHPRRTLLRLPRRGPGVRRGHRGERPDGRRRRTRHHDDRGHDHHGALDDDHHRRVDHTPRPAGPDEHHRGAMTRRRHAARRADPAARRRREVEPGGRSTRSDGSRPSPRRPTPGRPR